MPAPPIERLVSEKVNLFRKIGDDGEWIKIEPSYEVSSNYNVCNFVMGGHGISCEQYDNDDTISQETGRRLIDRLKWKCTFGSSWMKNIRVKEVEHQPTNRRITLEFTYSESPRGESQVDAEGEYKLATNKSQGSVVESEATGAGNQEANTSTFCIRSESKFDKPEDFPLAQLCSQLGPLHIRFEFRRRNYGDRMSWRAWNWSAAFAFLTGCSQYQSTHTKKIFDKFKIMALPDWLNAASDCEQFVDITPEDDGWYKVVSKAPPPSTILVKVVLQSTRYVNSANTSQRDSEGVAESFDQARERQKQKRSTEVSDRREVLLERLKAIGDEKANLAEEEARIEEELHQLGRE